MKYCTTAALTLAFSFSVAAQSDSNAPAPSLVPARPPQAAPAVGTLFMTPEERAQIGKPPPPPPPPPVVAAPVSRNAPVEAPPPARSVLNGFVKRSDGIATIWVDGREKTGLDEALLERITPESVGGSEGTLRVTVGGVRALLPAATEPQRRKIRRTPSVKPPSLLRVPKVKPRSNKQLRR